MKNLLALLLLNHIRLHHLSHSLSPYPFPLTAKQACIVWAVSLPFEFYYEMDFIHWKFTRTYSYHWFNCSQLYIHTDRMGLPSKMNFVQFDRNNNVLNVPEAWRCVNRRHINSKFLQMNLQFVDAGQIPYEIAHHFHRALLILL